MNRKLIEDCRADESRIVSGPRECVGTQLPIEKEHLLPLATKAFDLAEGGHLERAEPVLLVGDPGTGKTILPTVWRSLPSSTPASAHYDCRCTGNQLVEVQREQSLSRILARWSRVVLIVIDELGYVPLAEVAAELLFQVIADRAKKAAIMVTTNLPFSEWPRVFANARLCNAPHRSGTHHRNRFGVVPLP